MFNRIKRKILKKCVEHWNRIVEIGIVVLFFGPLFAVYIHENAFVFPLISYGIGLISIGIACHSLGMARKAKEIANSSDNKMTALAELTFVEKNAMIRKYINDFEDIKTASKKGNIIKDKNDIEKIKNGIKRFILDLKAAFKVISWIEEGTNKKFIDDFIELTKIVLDKSVFRHFDETDKSDYNDILEDSKKSKLRVDEIEILQGKI